MNLQTSDENKKEPQKILITRYLDGTSKVQGLRHDQILIKNNDGTFCVFIKRSKHIFNCIQFSTNYSLILVKEVSKKNLKGQKTRSVLQPISARPNQIKDPKVNQKGIKCVTSSLIETEDGLKVRVEGLAGNNFTQQQIKVIKNKIVAQYINGELF